MNEEEKVYCRYNSNLRGKGLRNAIMDANTTTALLANPRAIHPLDVTVNNNCIHVEKVFNILNDISPEAKIFILPSSDEGLIWARDNNIHILNMSLSDCSGSDILENQLSQTTLLLTSTGNTGNLDNHYETTSARNEWWCAVGACKLDRNNVELQSYSSWGLGSIFTCGLSSLNYLDDSSYTFVGTSAASPWNVGLLNQYYEIHYNNEGFYPTPHMALNFIKENSYKLGIGIKTQDLQSGWGIFRLPEEYDFETETGVYELDEITFSYYENKRMVNLQEILDFTGGVFQIVDMQNDKKKVLIFVDSNENKFYELFAESKFWDSYSSESIMTQDVETLIEDNKIYVNIDFLKEFLNFGYTILDDKIILKKGI